jgi:hypothetical protein
MRRQIAVLSGFKRGRNWSKSLQADMDLTDEIMQLHFASVCSVSTEETKFVVDDMDLGIQGEPVLGRKKLLQ